jgi:GNAT superfamily N-acetyltransferase
MPYGSCSAAAGSVASARGRIVETGSFDGGTVRTVFVAPDMRGRGVRGLLMAETDRAARRAGLVVLTVPSSVTAEGFYSKLGFRAVRHSYYGEERTIIMERDLTQP